MKSVKRIIKYAISDLKVELYARSRIFGGVIIWRRVHELKSCTMPKYYEDVLTYNMFSGFRSLHYSPDGYWYTENNEMVIDHPQFWARVNRPTKHVFFIR